MIDIYNYLDYRQFLREYYEERKRTTKSISHRSFAQSVGLSHSFFRFVMEGKRNLLPKTITKFQRALKLKKREADFFGALVSMNQAIDPEEKAQYYERLMTFKRFREIHALEYNTFQFLSKWYVPAVHELVALPDFDSDPFWIAKKLKPAITVTQAKEALEVLVNLKLVKLEAGTGKARQTMGEIETPSDVACMAITNTHMELLELARRAVKAWPPERREVTGVTFALSGEQFAEAKRMVREFRREMHAKFSHPTAPDGVYQFNIQIFPLCDER